MSCMVERNERESVLLADLSALKAKEAALQEQVLPAELNLRCLATGFTFSGRFSASRCSCRCQHRVSAAPAEEVCDMLPIHPRIQMTILMTRTRQMSDTDSSSGVRSSSTTRI